MRPKESAELSKEKILLVNTRTAGWYCRSSASSGRSKGMEPYKMCKRWCLEISENLLFLTTWSDLLTTLLACPLGSRWPNRNFAAAWLMRLTLSNFSSDFWLQPSGQLTRSRGLYIRRWWWSAPRTPRSEGFWVFPIVPKGPLLVMQECRLHFLHRVQSCSDMKRNMFHSSKTETGLHAL